MCVGCFLGGGFERDNVDELPILNPAMRKILPTSFFAFCVCVWALLCLVVVPTSAHAEPESPLHVRLEHFKIDPVSKKRLEPSDVAQVAPGDLLEYRATYTNQGAQVLSVVAVLPIPEYLEYAPNSAYQPGGPQHQVAQYEKQFAPEPLKKQVVSAAGVTEQVLVPYSDYRFVQWDVGRLAPGASVELRLWAKVASTAVPEKSEQ